jgi:hypothetical protein
MFSPTRLYSPISVLPDLEQRSQLLILLNRVNETWLDGVLRNSVYNEVLISLGKRPLDQGVESSIKRPVDVAIEPPTKQAVMLSSQSNQVFLEDRNITTIFDATGLLLILGEPGSGKTVTLLELAVDLVARVRDDAKERVPVILNLSSWKDSRPLMEWIREELSEKYRVPAKIANSWLQSDYLVPLLDGLDEVSTAVQPDCVKAINDFILGCKPSGLVICCRLMEYQWLPQRLKLNGAICLEPLSSEQVSKYLADGGSNLAALREAIKTDSMLQELTQTPLMLSIMSLAVRSYSGNVLSDYNEDSIKEREKQIFHLYVEEMFQRKGTNAIMFPKEKTISWLSWLAREMRANSQSVFLVEALQASCLSTRAERLAYGTIVLSIIGLIYGLIFGLSVGLNAGLSTGLIVGAVGWLGVGSLSHITFVESISWKWNRFWKGMIPYSIFGLIFGLIFTLNYGLSNGASNGVFFGLMFGMVGGVIVAFTDRPKMDKASPNQGINLSIKNSLIVFLVTWLSVGLTGAFIGWVMDSGQLSKAPFYWPIVGLTIGLIAGLNRGGSAVIKHYVLRLSLWWGGCMPLNLIGFLDQSARLIFLKKVGDSYIFIHRMLLEYFADLIPHKKPYEAGKFMKPM